jgi:hypothetical protein
VLEIFARYAAMALDAGDGIAGAMQRHGRANVLLRLGDALARAETEHAVAEHVARALRSLLDCDQVGVYLWDADRRLLTCGARHPADGVVSPRGEDTVLGEQDALVREWVSGAWQARTFVEPTLRALGSPGWNVNGALAATVAPVRMSDQLLGAIVASVRSDPSRLQLGGDQELTLSHVATHMASALLSVSGQRPHRHDV